ncbi:lipocalin-like domain-containing protein [uncultured Ruegeria sp.]|uniref:lipocalin-like domain-containing protein n=1 Tax=uncultured Ruegeria sp. TaxID=259304 RepID=UPI00260DE5F7|nr:lipocalin-like domain-containing protein [uncultured Ruegeria sp.]
MHKPTPLIGTWSLIDWYNETKTGERLYPLGPNATGYISYSQDGFVFVHMMAADRVSFETSDPFGGSTAEDSKAYKTQITYAGRYEYHGDHVIHHVTQASFPNWIGTEQVRQVSFSGQNLHLSATNAVFQGQKVNAFVEWRRAVT